MTGESSELSDTDARFQVISASGGIILLVEELEEAGFHIISASGGNNMLAEELGEVLVGSKILAVLSVLP